MTTKIIDAMARLDDVNALNALLAPMRDGATLKRKLRPGYRGHKYCYDRHSHTAHYLLTNGDVVSCYSVTEVSLGEAKAIAARCEGISEWCMTAFRAAVERALGVGRRRDSTRRSASIDVASLWTSGRCLAEEATGRRLPGPVWRPCQGASLSSDCRQGDAR